MLDKKQLFVVLALTSASALGAACGDDTGAGPTPVTDAGDAGDAAAPEAGPASLCVDGKPAVAYPPAPHAVDIARTLPPLELVGEGGATVKLADYFEPCAPKAKVLVVRAMAAWCGPCLWNADNTKSVLDRTSVASQLRVLDLLVADEDNLPPDAAALTRYKARVGADVAVALDPAFTFRPAQTSALPLPVYYFVDVRTMQVLSSISDPAPETLASRLLVELALLDGLPRPPLPRVAVDDGFSENQWGLLRAMTLPGAPPPDPTNEYADDPGAAALGKQLFFDTALSPNAVACSTCHDPAKELGDGVAQSLGVAKVDRNSPNIALSSHARWQFWDGRAENLWTQALGPPEDSKEIGSTRLYIAHQIAQRYQAAYDAVFTKYPLPDLSDAARFPATGKPGDAAWQGMTAADQDAVTRIYVNMGKAIAAFERTFRVKPNALDRYIAGDRAALAPAAKEGLASFFKSGCHQCHWGPRLTNDAFHVLRFPTGKQDGTADRGRADGVAKLLGAELHLGTKWSDAQKPVRPFVELSPPPPSMVGAFKTPTLRGLPKSGPYGHGGRFTTLAEVAKHYGDRGLEPNDPRAAGTVEPWVPNFDTSEQARLPAFLDVLTGEPEPIN